MAKSGASKKVTENCSDGLQSPRNSLVLSLSSDTTYPMQKT